MASASGNYFVRGYVVRSARGNARAFNDSVQVKHSGNATVARDMRKQLHIFVVEEDICVEKQKQKQIKNMVMREQLNIIFEIWINRN